MALATFYGQCRVVLSPSEAADRGLLELGIDADRIARWDRGVDLERFSPPTGASAPTPASTSSTRAA